MLNRDNDFSSFSRDAVQSLVLFSEAGTDITDEGMSPGWGKHDGAYDRFAAFEKYTDIDADRQFDVDRETEAACFLEKLSFSSGNLLLWPRDWRELRPSSKVAVEVPWFVFLDFFGTIYWRSALCWTLPDLLPAAGPPFFLCCPEGITLPMVCDISVLIVGYYVIFYLPARMWMGSTPVSDTIQPLFLANKRAGE